MSDFAVTIGSNGGQNKHSVDLPEISGDAIALLVRDIENKGFAVLPDYVKPELLAELREMVAKLIGSSGNQYAVLSGVEQMSNTPLEAIGNAPAFERLMHGVYEKGSGKAAPRQSLYQVLRCLIGQTGLQHAYFFHYDSYLVTALLPIVTPSEGKTGDLVMNPNRRKVRSSYLANVVDKLLVDNKWAQKRFRRNAIAQRGGMVKMKIVPGNLYFFWGYRSIHANEDCDVDQVRATALFHFGDPHMGSGIRRFTGSADARAKAETGLSK